MRRAVREGLCEKDGTTVCECVRMEEYVNVSELVYIVCERVSVVVLYVNVSLWYSI